MTILSLISSGAAILLLAGLWTPVAGILVVVLEAGAAVFHPVDLWRSVLIGTDGISLALLGPGAWSIDARLFGWIRIEIGTRKKGSDRGL